MTPQILLFLAMFMSFAVKADVPVHTWPPTRTSRRPPRLVIRGITLKIAGTGSCASTRRSRPTLPTSSTPS